MYYIGIDLAWTRKNESGICIIDEEKEILVCKTVMSDAAILELIESYQPAVVSIDGPLVVKNKTGSRKCDSLLMKTKINGHHLRLYASSRSYMNRQYGGIRGEELIEKGKHLNVEWLETFPTGIFLCLFPSLYDKRYKLSSRQSLEILISNFMGLCEAIQQKGFNYHPSVNVKTKKAYKSYEDEIDGVLCAINSYYFNKRSTQFQVDNNGCITLPITISVDYGV